MDKQVPRATASHLVQSATARTGRSGSRIHMSPIAHLARQLHDQGFPATVDSAGTLVLSVGTAQFCALSVRGSAAAIEVRGRHAGTQSILGLVATASLAAELIVEHARIAHAWLLAEELLDALVLAGHTSLVSEVPTRETLFVRLGDRTYTEITVIPADGQSQADPVATLHTHIADRSLTGLWSFDALYQDQVPTVAQIAGGQYSDAHGVCAAVDLHRCRTSVWEKLHR